MKAIRIVLIVLSIGVLAACKGSNDVYICTGPQSRVYHKHKNCTGLSRCSGTVESVSIDKAKSLGRRECKWCY